MTRSPWFHRTLHVCVRALLVLCSTTLIATSASAQGLDLPLSATQIRSLGQQTFELAATGGTPPYVYSKTPGTANVTGLRIQTGPPFPTNFSASATGALLAVFATPGQYQYSVRVTDSVGTTFDKVITISIADFQITSQTNPPRPTLGVPYQFDLATIGLHGTAGWSVSVGSPLPPGLNLDTGTLQISGTPTSAGTFNSLITLSDQGQAGNAGAGRGIFFTFVVNPYAITTNGQLADATNGVFYTQTIQAPGCGAPCTFTSTNGLPAGLSLNSTTGVLSGTPTGSTNGQAINISVTGTNGTSLKTFSIRIGFSGIQPVRIDTGPLLQSVVGGTASFALVAGGGTQPYTWEIVEGDTALPEGISIVGPGETISNNALPGYTLLAGRTMSPGQHVFHLKVTDAHGLESTKPITWNVSRVAHSYFNFPSGGTSPLAPPVYNQPYTQTLLGLGGTRPYTWVATTPMPGGLTLDSSTGVVSGTPTFTGTASVTVELRDAAVPGEFNSTNLNFTATGPTATTLSFGLAANQFLTRGQGFSQSLGISGGTGPYTVTVEAGSSLPPGFALLSGATSTAQDGSVVLAGTAITAGVYATAIRATDSLGNVGVRTFVFTISGMNIVTNALKVGAVGVPYDDRILVVGGSGTVTISLSPGFVMPAGLTLNSNGRITGTPTEPSSFNINVIATDSTGSTTPTRGLTLTISTISFADVSLTEVDSLPPVIIDKPYNFAFTATGGTGPITFSSGFVPGGLTLSSDGVISGTVTEPGWEGTWTVFVSASDGNSLVQRRFAMYILPKTQDLPSLFVTTQSLPDLVVGQTTTLTLTTPSDGKPPFTWEVGAGSTLPPGLSLIAGKRVPQNNVFGVDTTLLGGAPTTAGDYTFDLVATDANGTRMSRTFKLHVTAVAFLGVGNRGNAGGMRAGEAFSFQLTGVGGTPPYAFSYERGSFTDPPFPPGVDLSAAGLISGTPTSSGSYNARVTMTDSAGRKYSRNVTFQVFDFLNGGAGGLMVGSSNMFDNSVGIAVSQFLFLSRSSGSAPASTTWSVVGGALPPGMEFHEAGSSGMYLYGVPTAPGTYVYKLRGTNAANPAEFAEREFTYNVAPMQVISPPVGLFRGNMPNAEAGVPYQSQIKLAGGTRPYTFATLPTVLLPKGLTLSPNGVLSGTTDQIGNFTIPFTVTDSSSPTPATFMVSEVTLTVTPAGTPAPLTGHDDELLPGTVGQDYNTGGLLSLDLLVQGGARPFTWTLSAGSTLPPGIVLIPGNSAVSANMGGKPTTAGEYAFSLDVEDAVGQKLTLSFTLPVGNLGISPARIPNGNVGTPYNAQLTPSGGTAPYTFFDIHAGLFEGAGMPPGLTLSSSGLISGTPTSPGNYAVPVFLSDNAGGEFLAIYRVTIDNDQGHAKAVSVSPSIFEINHVQGAPGAPIPLTIGITHGAPSFTATIVGIPGASLSSNSGSTPTQITMDLNLAGLAEGTYHGQVAVNVPGAANLFDTAPITINVGPPPTVSAISVTPNAGGPGISQVFTLAYSDSVGVASDLVQAQVRFTNNASATTCMVHYRATTDEVRLQDDAGVWGSWVHFGAGTLSNSRCSLNLATSSANRSGTDLSMALDMAFTGVFAGPATIAMRAGSIAGPNTGWVNRGTYTVGVDLSATSVTPNSGTGMSGTFTATFSDSLGVTTDLKSARVRFAGVSGGTCLVDYNAITNLVRLQTDAGDWMSAVAPGTATTLANSQCSLDVAQTSATPSGTDLTLAVRLTFTSAFLGAKTVALRANSNFGTVTTGFVQRGTWTVGATVAAVSISPINGSSVTNVAQDFVLTYSDSEGVTNDLRGAKVRFIATNVRCVVDYNAMTGMIRMQNDAGVWGTPKALGVNGVLNDSTKCSIDLLQSGAAALDTDLTLILHVTFSSTFTANVAMRADSNAIGNALTWTEKGTWTVSTP